MCGPVFSPVVVHYPGIIGDGVRGVKGGVQIVYESQEKVKKQQLSKQRSVDECVFRFKRIDHQAGDQACEYDYDYSSQHSQNSSRSPSEGDHSRNEINPFRLLMLNDLSVTIGPMDNLVLIPLRAFAESPFPAPEMVM